VLDIWVAERKIVSFCDEHLGVNRIVGIVVFVIFEDLG